jgi:hypothetical protein
MRREVSRRCSRDDRLHSFESSALGRVLMRRGADLGVMRDLSGLLLSLHQPRGVAMPRRGHFDVAFVASFCQSLRADSVHRSLATPYACTRFRFDAGLKLETSRADMTFSF